MLLNALLRPTYTALDADQALLALEGFGALSPSEDAAGKLVYLAIQSAVPQWTRTRGWTTRYSRSSPLRADQARFTGHRTDPRGALGVLMWLGVVL